jgi:hypothetical protein
MIFYALTVPFTVWSKNDFDNMERWPLPHPFAHRKWCNYHVTPEKILIEGRAYSIIEIL